MVIHEATGRFESRPELFDAVFETFGHGDRADGADFFPFEILKGAGLASFDVLEVAGTMLALDDLGGPVVEADAVDEFIVGVTVALRDENVGGPLQVAWRFSEGAAGEESLGAEGVPAIHENNVEAMTEAKILEAVVEDEGVAVEFPNGVATAFDPVFINDDGDIGKVCREHVGFIASGFGIEKEGLSIADDAGRVDFVFPLDLSDESSEKGLLHRFVTPAQDRNAASAVLEGAGEFFNNGRFAGSSNGEVADTDDEASEIPLPHDAVSVEPEAQADNRFVEL